MSHLSRTAHVETDYTVAQALAVRQATRWGGRWVVAMHPTLQGYVTCTADVADYSGLRVFYVAPLVPVFA